MVAEDRANRESPSTSQSVTSSNSSSAPSSRKISEDKPKSAYSYLFLVNKRRLFYNSIKKFKDSYHFINSYLESRSKLNLLNLF